MGILLYIFLSAGPIAGLTTDSDYLVYYGEWNDDILFRAKDFDLVILEPSAISDEQLQSLKRGHDGISGTDDDVIVIAYLSIGEVDSGNIVGDGRGPCYYDTLSSSIIYTNNGFASFYLDDADHNGLPDRNGTWGSYYVNAGDTLWWQYVDAKADALQARGFDGFFLDTIDTANPWGPYFWTYRGMSRLIQHLRERYPQKFLIANRGLFYFSPYWYRNTPYNIRPYINGVLFEAYYTSWDWQADTGIVSPYFEENRNNWAVWVNEEASQPDGFTVFALDYLNPSQASYEIMLRNQIQYTIVENHWLSYVTYILLDTITYGVFHNHCEDHNPPTWKSHIGIYDVNFQGDSIEILAGLAEDQTPPVNYYVYYSTSPFNSPEEAADSIGPLTYQVVNNLVRFRIPALPPGTYHFMVRARDNCNPPHEDKNTRLKELIIQSVKEEGEKVLFSKNGTLDFSSLSNLLGAIDHLEIYSATGQIIFKAKSATQKEITLPQGVYLAKVRQKGRELILRIIVLN